MAPPETDGPDKYYVIHNKARDVRCDCNLHALSITLNNYRVFYVTVLLFKVAVVMDTCDEHFSINLC